MVKKIEPIDWEPDQLDKYLLKSEKLSTKLKYAPMNFKKLLSDKIEEMKG